MQILPADSPNWGCANWHLLWLYSHNYPSSKNPSSNNLNYPFNSYSDAITCSLRWQPGSWEENVRNRHNLLTEMRFECFLLGADSNGPFNFSTYFYCHICFLLFNLPVLYIHHRLFCLTSWRLRIRNVCFVFFITSVFEAKKGFFMFESWSWFCWWGILVLRFPPEPHSTLRLKTSFFF